MVYVYRDIYNYLHGVDKYLLGANIIKYSSHYTQVVDDIAEGGFIKIYINNKKYTIIDNGYSILLLRNYKFYHPTQSDMIIINNLYLKYNFDVLSM